MTLRTPLSKRLLITLAASAGLCLIPLTTASNQGLAPNDACAGGQCCMETQSFCGQLAGYYHALDKCGYQEPGLD